AAGRQVAEVRVLAEVAHYRGDRAAVLVEGDDPGVDVGGAGDRRGVAQVVRHLADHPGDGALAGGLALGPHGHGQAHRRQHGRVPGAEVLGGERAARYLTDVVVDVRGGDVVPARPAAVLQQLFSAVPAP